MRSIWTGAIGFGLVNIPVKLYSATQNSELDLDMLDKKDESNIRFQRVNATTGKVVPYENIVRAYKYNDRYVILNSEDFESANAKKSKVIEIEDFVQEDEIDSTYYETPYYLEPDKSGVRAYALLREALKKSGKVGIATFVLRSKEHLAILKPSANVIVLNRIRFFEEIRDESELNLPGKDEVKPKELEMAMSLIGQLSSKFDIEKYKDTYTEQLMKVIKAKAKGAKIVAPKLEVVHRTGDLMSQLKESLSSGKKKAS
ncbi:MAG: Ku protein [Chitinophagales bacterium]|nr:Ku protein [Chitinophagales bacterium]